MASEKKINHKKEFIALLNKLSIKHSDWQVWNDFLCMSAISMANTVLVSEREEREKQYLDMVKRYDKEEVNIFPHLLAIVTEALTENPCQDFLGEIYQELGLNQHQKGQFFTPYYICELMSEMQVGDVNMESQLSEKGYLSVNDPACGAGATLIAFANVMHKHGVNYQEKVLFVAQDIDRTAGMICYVQLSLLGCPAIVIIGDTLARPGMHPDNDIWYTPFYYLNAWRFNEDGNEQKHMEVMKCEDYAEEAGGQLSFEVKAS